MCRNLIRTANLRIYRGEMDPEHDDLFDDNELRSADELVIVLDPILSRADLCYTYPGLNINLEQVSLSTRLSTYKVKRQFFLTGRRIAPKFCTHVRIETRLTLS